ncbi:3-oxoadipate enol-lactonase [Deltaproteobacteria bacterium]|nr:3-oxoadipate enol-lactonase [Deltaproteobacteria bacterium]
MPPLNGTHLHVLDTGGDLPVLVFSHGLLFNSRMFDRQIEHFKPRFRVIAYDHRGQGRSADDPARSISIETVTADALALLDHFGIQNAHFAGLSMGGFVGMRLAARHPERIASLVLLETAAGPESAAFIPRYTWMNRVARWIGLWPVADQVMPILFGRTFLADPARAQEKARWRAELTGNRRSIWRAVNGVIEREGIEGELANIRCPTTVIVGDEDVATPLKRAQAIVAAIPGAAIVRIPNAGHSSTIEAPDAVIAAMEGHFAARSPHTRSE